MQRSILYKFILLGIRPAMVIAVLCIGCCPIFAAAQADSNSISIPIRSVTDTGAEFRVAGSGWATQHTINASDQVYFGVPIDTGKTQKKELVMDQSTQDSGFHLIPFQDKTGKWGYLDRATKQVRIAPAYQWVDLFDQGVAKVTQGRSDAGNKEALDLYGWIDKTGKEIFKPQFTSVYDVNAFLGDKKLQGLQLVGLPDGSHGVVDLIKGDWLVRPGLYKDFTFYDRTHYLADKKVFMADGIIYKAPAGCVITRVDLENKTFTIQKGNEMHMGVSSWAGAFIIAPKYLDITYLSSANRYLASRLSKSISGAALMALLQSGKGAGKIISELIDSDGNILGSYQADEMADVYQDSLGHYTNGGSDFYFSLASGALVAAPAPELNSGRFRLFKKNLLWGVRAQNINAGDKAAEEQIIIPPIYTQLTFINDHLVLATKPTGNYSSVQGVLDLARGGKAVIAFDYARLEYVAADASAALPAHFRAYKDGGHGIIDMQGQVVVPMVYYNDVLYTGARAIVYKDYRSGVIGGKGQVIIAPKYKTIFSSTLRESHPEADRGEDSNNHSMAEYYAVENEASRWGLMDSTGNTVIPFEYGFVSTGAQSFENGWVSIEDTARNHHGKINLRSGVKLAPVYDIIRIYDDFIIVAKREENTYYYQLLDTKGHPLTDMVYTGMDYLKEGKYLLCQRDKKYGVLDNKAVLLVPFIYDYLWAKKADLLMAQMDQAYFYLDTKGQVYKDPAL